MFITKFPFRLSLSHIRTNDAHILFRRLSSSIASQYSHLEAFKEFTEGVLFERKGEFSRALPLIQRVYDVSANVTGSGSFMSSAAAIRLSQLHRLMGQYDAAETALQISCLSGLPKAYALQSLAETKLLNGDSLGSLEAAKEACLLAESQDSADTDVTVFFGCYTMRGIAELCLDRLPAAEDSLQQAARWSTCAGPRAEVQAMSNLGALHWLGYSSTKGGSGGGDGDTRNPLGTSPQNKQPHAEVSAEVDADEAIKALHAALDCWEEGVAGAALGAIESGGAMCGPGADVADARSAASSSCPSSSPSLSTAAAGSQLIDDRCRELGFAVSYADLLCSAALAHQLLQDDARSADRTAQALRALDAHADSAAAGPARGRALGLAARAHVDAGNAVTAEGLFRGALEALTTPFAKHDPRYQRERCILLMAYGSLLQKWDKREVEGARLVGQAEELLATLPKFQDSPMLSPALHLPLSALSL